MDLYINSFGTYIRQRDGMFELEKDNQKFTVAPKKVRSILISTHALITTDVIKTALDNNIDIVVMDDFGDPVGRFWHARFGSTAFIRRRQMEIFENEEGLVFVKEWISNKINQGIKHLQDLKYKRDSKAEYIEQKILEIEAFLPKINNLEGNIDQQRQSLQGYEGNASKIYYSVLSELVPKAFQFKGRSFRPAKDEFNCLLNYAYGVLYSRVEKACIIAGLDPFVGIMHTDNYNKKSLVFDLIENYRHLATRTVFNLFSRKKVNKGFFKEIKGGMTLNKEGKQALLEDFTEFLSRKILHNNRKLAQGDIIQFDCHRLAQQLIGKV